MAKLAANVECNAVAGVHITHLFVNRMLEKKLKARAHPTTRGAPTRGAASHSHTPRACALRWEHT